MKAKKGKYPKIYLAMDNCVLYKRWITPDEWSRIIKDLGIRYIEASADTELDPLYMGREYLADWVKAVKVAEEKHQVKVCNVYSGHGSYTTLGLAHPDKRVRDNMLYNFIFPLIETAGELDCGLGFFAHAFCHNVLQSKESYEQYVDILMEELSKVIRYAKEQKCKKVSLEKMYTPHQYPWRNQDVYHLLCEVRKRSGLDFYFTEDVGHHHNKFEYPDAQDISFNPVGDAWLGTDRAFSLAKAQKDNFINEVQEEIQNNPQLFSHPSDADCYETLRLYGCYSPIIHLQQTDGVSSHHSPFTDEQNQKGKIEGRRLLKAIKEAYDRETPEGMPDQCEEIYLTLELFSGTTSIMEKVLDDCRKSVSYWREFVPKDGMYLDELLERL